VATLTGPAGTTAATFRRDGPDDMLATADQSGTPVLWDLDPKRLKAKLCSGPRPMLTETEWAIHVPDQPYRDVCR
jgi:hypothetical protein